MTPELYNRVRATWNLRAERQDRRCGCVWVITSTPYRSRYCAEHAPVIQALLECRSMR